MYLALVIFDDSRSLNHAAGTRYTIRNTGYPAITYAYSTGQDGAAVTGNMLATEWLAIPHDGVFS